MPETPDEEQFAQQFGTPIKTIYTILVKYRATRNPQLVNQAYTELYKV